MRLHALTSVLREATAQALAPQNKASKQLPLPLSPGPSAAKPVKKLARPLSPLEKPIPKHPDPWWHEDILNHPKGTPFHIYALAHHAYHGGTDPTRTGNKEKYDKSAHDALARAVAEHRGEQDTSHYQAMANAQKAPVPKGRRLYKPLHPDSVDLHERHENITQAPVAARMATLWYSHKGDRHFHNLLRHGAGDLNSNSPVENEAAHQMIPHLDQYTRANRLQHDAILHRGGAFSPAMIARIAEPGHRFKDNSYTSTSADEQTAHMFGGMAMDHAPEDYEPVHFHIEAPAGSHAGVTNPYSNYEENEFLLPRGSEFTTTKYRKDPDGSHHVHVRLKTPDEAPPLPQKHWNTPEPQDFDQVIDDTDLTSDVIPGNLHALPYDNHSN